MIINNNYAFSHKLKYTMKRNGFVGGLLPVISGVENHPVKKTPRATVPRRKLCYKTGVNSRLSYS